MKIFGLGLSRTGTKSLAEALGKLGFRIAHFPRDRRTCKELFSGQSCRFSLLERYDGITDITTIPFFRCLDETYRGSKFVLTVRGREEWLSAMEHHLRKNPLSRWFPDILRERKIRRLLRMRVFGRIDFEREHFSRVYESHHFSVEEYFRARTESLLVMDITAGDGWEKLCPFLGEEIRYDPFPHI
jgi:hypothetical protein